MNVNDRQVGGTHYQSRFQHWDFTVEVLENRYLEGAVAKYVTRHRGKNGRQDIEKALHFMQKLISVFEEGKILPLGHRDGRLQKAVEFCHCNACGPVERTAITTLSVWGTLQDLYKVQGYIAQLLEEY